MDLPERARRRIRDEMRRNGRSQQDVADLLKWTQSRVAQKLTGRTPITLDELEALCFGANLSVVEAVRDHGLEFCADMTPSELRILERLRQLPRPAVEAVMTIIQLKVKTGKPERHATPIAPPIRKVRYPRS